MQAGTTLALVALAAVLGGCAAPPGEAASVDDAAPAPPAPPSTVVFQDCVGFSVIVEAPGEWVREKLPPGYEPFTGPASVQGIPLDVPLDVSLPGLVANRCTLSFDDGSVHRDAVFAFGLVALDSAGGHGIEEEQEDAYDDYVLELFFDIDALPGLAGHFAPYGWPVHDAAIDLGWDTFRIASSDGITYDGRLGANVFPYAGDETGEDDTPTRYHHVAGAPSYGTLGDLEHRSYTIYTATLLAQGGFFGSLGGSEGLRPFAGVGQRHMVAGPSGIQWADAPAA